MKSFSLLKQCAFSLTLSWCGVASSNPMPEWYGEKWLFDFSEHQPGDPNQDVASEPIFVGLRNVPGYPISVQVRSADDCHVGATPVWFNHVYLEVDGKRIDPLTNQFMLFDENLHQFRLIFDGLGGYGDLVGQVACADYGALEISF